MSRKLFHETYKADTQKSARVLKFKKAKYYATTSTPAFWSHPVILRDYFWFCVQESPWQCLVTICSARDQILVGCTQGKCLTISSIHCDHVSTNFTMHQTLKC